MIGLWTVFCRQVGVLLNSSNPNRTQEHMKKIIQLETRIAQITASSAERRNEEKFYHAMTVTELQHMAPFVSLPCHFKFHTVKNSCRWHSIPSTDDLDRLFQFGILASEHHHFPITRRCRVCHRVSQKVVRHRSRNGGHWRGKNVSSFSKFKSWFIKNNLILVVLIRFF